MTRTRGTSFRIPAPDRGAGVLHLAFFLGLLGFIAVGCDPGPPPESVSGVVSLGPGLPPEARRVRTLFIILEPEGGGAPIAVQRLVETKLPYRYVLTPDDRVGRGTRFRGPVRVRAWLDGDGDVRTFVRGDFRGRSERAYPIGARDADVVIREAGTAAPPPKKARKPRRPAPQTARANPPKPGAPSAITGTVSLSPALAEKAAGKPVLFLIARSERPGPPLAVVRIPRPRFPLRFTISQANVMMRGVRFEGRVRLTARLDSDGRAGPPRPGDLEGAAGPVKVGASGVNILIDKER